jgi:hypothetical protein
VIEAPRGRADGRYPAAMHRLRVPTICGIAASLAAAALLLTLVPGPFTVDENHHLVAVRAMRQGQLTVAGTADLTPSRSILWFDPQASSRDVVRTPIAPRIPAIYALIALPFALLGWYGLAGLNVLGYLAIGGLVFAYVRRYARGADAPWIAAAAFLLGGYSIEYAQGLWPHMLAAALTTAACLLAARVRDGASELAALLAGWLAGLAGGIRYQNFFLAGCVGLALLVFARQRLRSAAAFGVGLGVPLVASGLLNWLRQGSANPISKGGNYLEIVDAPRRASLLADSWTMAWARIVDFSTRPPLGGEHLSYLHKEASTGAYLVDWTVKKAWLQSAPWIALALCALAVAWAPRSAEGSARRRELRALSLVVFPVLLLFALAGVRRTDGLGYNMRYFLELVPLAAVAFALALDRIGADRRDLLTGGFAGAVVSWVWLSLPWAHEARFWSVLRIPLALAAAAAAAWLFALRGTLLGRRLAGALAGAAVAWALIVHVVDDLPASRDRRARNLAVAQVLDRQLPPAPEKIALFVWWGMKNGVGPLLFDRDILVVEARLDQARSMGALLDDVLRAGRRTFVVVNGFPPAVLTEKLAGRTTRQHGDPPTVLLEVVPEPAAIPPQNR